MNANAYKIVQDAIAFAARAHKDQLRKDGKTPYVSHVFRVAMTARHVFGIDDPSVLAAALLHDTIEDTTTDHDDLSEHFGQQVADWVAALTKNKSLPHDEREATYARGLTTAPWQVQVCKLADIFDNLSDGDTLTAKGRERGLANARRYLDALHAGLQEQARSAWQLVFALYEEKLAQ